MNRCPSVHAWSGVRCIREVGHEGLCWSKAVAGFRVITRTMWRSANGVFKSHHQYDTKHPVNAATEKK